LGDITQEHLHWLEVVIERRTRVAAVSQRIDGVGEDEPHRITLII
jgi:hypothetical protein